MKASIALAAALGFQLLSLPVSARTLEADFDNPPPDARPMVWWHWMGKNISREGITKDLEAMKDAGIGGATIFNLASSVQADDAPLKNTPWPENDYRGPAWWKLVKHAAEEADRLGLNLGMHNCVGYSATGGPWITPKKSMKAVVFSATPVKGGTRFEGHLPQPAEKLGFYRDIAVIAVPDAAEIPRESVVDLIGRMAADGTLDWEAPPGSWLVYRFGYTTTGRGCHPAPEEVKTLECDKLSAADSKFHFDQVLMPLKENLGPLLGKSLRHLTLDSYEAGNLNWTETFRDEFTRRRGYDPVPWLPVLDKKVIGNADLSGRFVSDMKATVSDLFVQNNFRQGKALMNAMGVQMYLEPYSGPFDTVEAAAVPDMTMGEFWNPGGGDIGRNIIGPAQAAGIRIIGAEAFTATPVNAGWIETPGKLKASGDGAWASGVNRLVLHHWVHQPLPDLLKPGIGMGWWGTHFGRNQTWYEPGKAWISYLARSQALLQRGEPVSDFLALDQSANLPSNRADTISAADLIGQATVKEGRIVLRSGRSYAFLQLPATSQILPATARKIRELVAAGAVVAGQQPLSSPSLQDYAKADEEVAAIGRELWGDKGEQVRTVGKGRIFQKTADALAAMNLGPDFSAQPNLPNALRFTHRRDADTDIYFVANVSGETQRFAADLRVTGKIPELWDAERGTRRPAKRWQMQDGTTRVNLDLPGNTSIFIVLRQPTAETASAPVPAGEPAPAPLDIKGPWEIGFAANKKIRQPELVSWTAADDPAIRYFSGTATYRKTIDVPGDFLKPGHAILLSLGDVREIAHVRVNGADCGVAWHAPFEVPVETALKPGANTLEIEVTNTWANRQIGDEQEPPDAAYTEPVAQKIWKDKAGNPLPVGRMLVEFPDWILQGQPRPTRRQTFCTWNYFTKDSPLADSGLLGPIQLVHED